MNLQQLFQANDAIIQCFGQNNNLSVETVNIIIENLQLIQVKIAEIQKKISVIPDYDKLTAALNKMHATFVDKHQIKTQNIPDTHINGYNVRKNQTFNEFGDVKNAMMEIESQQYEINFKIITDLTGCTLISRLQFVYLFVKQETIEQIKDTKPIKSHLKVVN
ncbi:MAG: hypothetical protein WC389_19730 [Lutibacter sp.]|jgi:hypothetical protein